MSQLIRQPASGGGIAAIIGNENDKGFGTKAWTLLPFADGSGTLWPVNLRFMGVKQVLISSELIKG